MNLQLRMEKEDFEPVLLDLVSRALQRPISANEIQEISIVYRPSSNSQMNVSIILPSLNPPPPDQPQEQHQ